MKFEISLQAELHSVFPQMALNTKHHSQKVADETDEWEQTWQIP